MTVYVDDMHRHAAGRFRRMKMSHMIADTEAELHAMADRIGVARRWYQGGHYDICLAKRALAVQAGAVEVTWRQLGLMVVRRRRTGQLGTPEATETDARTLFENDHHTVRELVETMVRITAVAGVPPAVPDPECRCRPSGQADLVDDPRLVPQHEHGARIEARGGHEGGPGDQQVSGPAQHPLDALPVPAHLLDDEIEVFDHAPSSPSGDANARGGTRGTG